MGLVISRLRLGYRRYLWSTYKKSDMDKNKGESDDGETGTATATGEGSDENAASIVPRQGLISVLGLTLGLLVGTGMLLS
jgi:hypothetical protein